MTRYEEAFCEALKAQYLDILQEASSALDAACKLLDKRFGSRLWRNEWSIAETADKIRHEAFGYESFEAAEEEAAQRKATDGRDWSARFDATGAPVVALDD